MMFTLSEITSYKCTGEQLINHFISIAKGERTTHEKCRKTLRLDKCSPKAVQETTAAGTQELTRNKSIRLSAPINKPSLLKHQDSIITAANRSARKSRLTSNQSVLILDSIRLCDYTKNSRHTSGEALPAVNFSKRPSWSENDIQKVSEKVQRVNKTRPFVENMVDDTSNIKNIKIEHLQPSNLEIFDIGILFWQMLIRQKPFQTPGDKKLIKCLIKEFAQPEFSDGIPKNLKKIISSCWEASPKFQPNTDNLVKIFEGQIVDKEYLILLDEYLNNLQNEVDKLRAGEYVFINFGEKSLSGSYSKEKNRIYLILLVLVIFGMVVFILAYN